MINNCRCNIMRNIRKMEEEVRCILKKTCGCNKEKKICKNRCDDKNICEKNSHNNCGCDNKAEKCCH